MIGFRLCIIACVLMLNSSLLSAKDAFVGDWFSCSLELGGPPQGAIVLQINKTGLMYDVFQERMHWSFIGRGKLVNGQLHAKGCHYYDGKAVDGCDVINPPLNFKLKKSEFKRKYKVLNLSLKKGEWMLINKKEGELDKLIDRCRELAEQQNLDKDGWPKDF